MQVTRWLEPFIDYGPDYNRATPFYDATIALGRHARELYSRRGGVEESLGASLMREVSVSGIPTPSRCLHRPSSCR
jgi:hypothetical protein